MITADASAQPNISLREPIIPHAVLGMLIFIATEVMFFAGLVSSFTVVRLSAEGGVWPPPGQPRLPVEETAINTAALLLSGVCLYWAQRAFKRSPAQAKIPFLFTILLGIFFVAFQGAEWMALIGEGLTASSSLHGGFFYLIIGTHALHAIGALTALAFCYVKLLQNKLTPAGFWAMRLFWYFVVGVWPILYWRVYL